MSRVRVSSPAVTSPSPGALGWARVRVHPVSRWRGVPSWRGCRPGFSRERPPRLAELSPLAETEDPCRDYPVQQHFAAPDRVTEARPCAVGCREIGAVLRLVPIGDSATFDGIAHVGGVTLYGDVEAIQAIAAGREDAVRVLHEILGLSLRGTGAEVHGSLEPDS